MKHDRESRGAIYGAILRYFLLTTTVLIIGASAALYASYENIALRQAYENDREDLEKSKNQILSMRSLARTLTSQVYYDVSVAYLLYGGDFNAYQLRAAMAQLDNYRLTIPFVESIYVYNGATRSLSASSGTFGGYGIPIDDEKAFYFDPGLPRIIAQIAKLDPTTPITRTIRVRSSSGQTTKNYCTFISRETQPAGPARSAVLVNFSDKWLYRNMDGRPSPSRAVITDLGGLVVSNSAEYPMGSDLSKQPFFARIASGDDGSIGAIGTGGSGHLIASVSGLKSLVTFISPDTIGWRYIKITSYSEITAGIRKIRWLTIAFDLIFLAMGAATSIVVSRRLYKPIGVVEGNLVALEKENRGIRGLREQQELRDLLASRSGGKPAAAGMAPTTADPAPAGPAKAGPDATGDDRASRSMRLVVARIDESARLEAERGPEERRRMRGAALELASIHFPRVWTVRTVDMGESGNLVLVVSSDDGSERVADDSFIASCTEDAKKSILAELGISVSFVIGGTVRELSGLNPLYERASEAIRHRILAGPGAVLMESDITAKNARYYTYPSKKEECLVDAIMEGKQDRARELLDEILVDSAGYSFAVFSGCVSRLVITIGNIVNSVRKNNLVHVPEGILTKIAAPVNPYAAESLGEIRDFLFEVTGEIVACVGEKRGARHDELVARVDALVDSGYPDPGMCLESIATEVGMSSEYLGRIYKRHALKSVAERITEVRLREAKRLLREERNLSVAQVAASVGFTGGSYFSKLFRKEMALTPNEFRREARKQDPETDETPRA